MPNISDISIEDMYPSNLITDVEAAKEAILANTRLSDIAKLKYIFDLSKENLKKRDPSYIMLFLLLFILQNA